MRRAIRNVMLAGFVLAIAVRIGAPTAEAHGVADQTLAGDPGCIAAALKGEILTSSGPLQQEIVPAAADIVGIDVCLTLTSAAVVQVELHSGTIAIPASILNSGTTPNPAETDWVHVEFPVTTPVTPGGNYFIEVKVAGGAPFKWRGTCGSTPVLPCTAQDPDLYTAGFSSVPATVRDFAFRTFAEQDNDRDGVNDGVDNCVGVYNPPPVPGGAQTNSDSNVTDLAPWGITAYDDATWPYHDDAGDACDGDDDNDGILDATELAGPCGAPTLPLVRDTDGDLVIDSAECALSTNPNDPASRPPASYPNGDGPNDDKDGDGLTNAFEVSVTGTFIDDADYDNDNVIDGREFKYFGSALLIANTDGDACSDAKEVYSVNADSAVTAIDLSQIAQRFGAKLIGIPPTPVYVPTLDVTRDGTISAIDLSQVAQNFGPCI